MKRRISDASLYCLHAAVQPYDVDIATPKLIKEKEL